MKAPSSEHSTLQTLPPSPVPGGGEGVGRPRTQGELPLLRPSCSLVFKPGGGGGPWLTMSCDCQSCTAPPPPHSQSTYSPDFILKQRYKAPSQSRGAGAQGGGPMSQGGGSGRDVGHQGSVLLLSRLSSHYWLLGSAQLAGIQASVSPSVLWEPSIDGLEAPLAHALQAPQGCGAAADPKAPLHWGAKDGTGGWELCTPRACSQPSPLASHAPHARELRHFGYSRETGEWGVSEKRRGRWMGRGLWGSQPQVWVPAQHGHVLRPHPHLGMHGLGEAAVWSTHWLVEGPGVGACWGRGWVASPEGL